MREYTLIEALLNIGQADVRIQDTGGRHLDIKAVRQMTVGGSVLTILIPADPPIPADPDQAALDLVPSKGRAAAVSN